MAGLLDIDEIRKRREAKDLTQAAAAEKAGVTRQRWNDVESGRKANIELDTLQRIGKALGCDPKDLLK